jgi:phage tail sheath protein FI
MAENINKAPYIKLSELDLSGRSPRVPVGIPAGVIGTSNKGPAFVPVTVPDLTSFVSYFGNVDSDHVATIGMSEWLQNAEAGTFVRVLGVGDGDRRDLTTGKVNRAGYVVGDSQVQSDGLVGNNSFTDGTYDQPGRTYFLGTFCTGQALEKAGVRSALDPATPVIRAIIHVASGVVAQLASDLDNNNSTADVFGSLGDVDGTNGNDTVRLKLSGFSSPYGNPDIYDFSFNSDSDNNILNVLNTDPTQIEIKGHYVQSYYEVDSTIVVDKTGIVTATRTNTNIKPLAAFAFVSSKGHNTGTNPVGDYVGVPNYDSYEDRYSSAFTPWIISQNLGSNPIKLFRFHALDDGENGNQIRVEIRNISYPSIDGNYGKFVVSIQQLFDKNGKKVILEEFNADLNPESPNFIGRVIGDAKIYYDFDKNAESQKLVVDGFYPNVSRYVRVEINDSIYDANIDPETIPMGFEGLNHLVTSGFYDNNKPILAESLLGGGIYASSLSENAFNTSLAKVIQPPVPLRSKISVGSAPNESINFNITWGFNTSTEGTTSSESKRKSVYENSLKSFLSYHPSFSKDSQKSWVGDNSGTPDLGQSILDANRFNNNYFTLEKIGVVVNPLTNKIIIDELAASRYFRDSQITDLNSSRTNLVYSLASNQVRFLAPTDLAGSSDLLPLSAFTVPFQGGFNGTNIYDQNKKNLNNIAVSREFLDADQGGPNGPTITSYKKALQVMEGKSDVDIKLLAIPGIRHESVTKLAVDTVERRFDALYIMDVQELDKFNNDVTGSNAEVSVTNTINNHINYNFDSSFAAAYFPDTYQRLPGTSEIAKCPPSVSVLGVMAFNDRQAPWFAPAGFNRGILSRTDRTAIVLNTKNLDDLYTAKINPIATFNNAQSGGASTIAVYGQKTLQKAESALDRVNVRRLLIEIRRQVRAVANTLLFEPNREDTLARFQNAVTPILARIQSAQGLDRFRVQIDASTTTQADIENNTIRGKIFLQPTKTTEFISLTFEVGNSIA